MKYIPVTIVAPNGEEYHAEIDADADEATLLEDLVSGLELPTRDRDSRLEYGFSLLGGVTLKPGRVIQVYQVKPATVKGLRRVKGLKRKAK